MRIRIAGVWAVIWCTVYGAAGPVFAETALTVKAPLELQVIQRNEQNQAEVTVSGVMRGAADTIEAKADLHPGTRYGKPVAWTTIASGSQIDNGSFAGRMTLTAGGWYTMTIRARQGDGVTARATIARVGVGEVFITAGQSNSANYGRPRQAAQDDRVVYYDGKTFVPARDPIPGACGSGGSVWPVLGDHIVKSQQVPVCFRSASLTWTEVKNWLPGVTYRKWRLYDNLVSCVGEFGGGGIRAVLWHQGESDSLARTPAETYCERLKTIIESLNRDTGDDIPWFVAQASFHPGSAKPAENEVARGQRLLWQRGIAHPGPTTDDLGQEYRADRVHFNQLGLNAHAERWFNALAAEYKWTAESSDSGTRNTP